MPHEHHIPRPSDPEPRAGGHAPLRALARAIDQAFEAQRTVLARRLDRLEQALAHADPPTREHAGEQVALIRVGLSCLAEAIGQLPDKLGSDPDGRNDCCGRGDRGTS